MTDTLAALIERIDKRLMEVREAGFDDVRVYHADWCRLRDALPVWRPIDTCPEKQPVLFGWANGKSPEPVIGRMERATLRMGGYKRDYYWGGPWADWADNNPPTHWMPLPKPPEEA